MANFGAGLVAAVLKASSIAATKQVSRNSCIWLQAQQCATMIVIPTAIWAHYIGDLAAWSSAAALGIWQNRRWPKQTTELSRSTDPGYFLALSISALIGAWVFGSANTASVSFAPSHSIAGALAGGIVGVEVWKIRHGIRRSTGGAFVLPLSIGIIIGRFGCLFSGIPDYTYGIPTSLPWAVVLGDGIARHPVQIYESMIMALFLMTYLHARLKGREWAVSHGFHAMIIVYATQRFLLEFLKPYPKLIGPLNVFHLLMIGLVIYGVIWWNQGKDREIA